LNFNFFKVIISWHTLISTLGWQHLVLIQKVIVLFSYTNKDETPLIVEPRKASEHLDMCMLICVPRKQRTPRRSGVAMYLSCGD
jgi:hypothetical protein